MEIMIFESLLTYMYQVDAALEIGLQHATTLWKSNPKPPGISTPNVYLVRCLLLAHMWSMLYYADSCSTGCRGSRSFAMDPLPHSKCRSGVCSYVSQHTQISQGQHEIGPRIVVASSCSSDGGSSGSGSSSRSRRNVRSQ